MMLIFIVLILLSALFAASETALLSLCESQVRMIRKNKKSSHIIAKLILTRTAALNIV